MTPAHLKTTLAALALAGTPPHLRASQGITMSAGPAPAPAAGAAPRGAAPHAASPGFSWDEVVAETNAQAGQGQPQAAAPVADPEHHIPGASRASYTPEVIDWAATVAALNAENGCTRPGANPDPRMVAMITGGDAR